MKQPTASVTTRIAKWSALHPWTATLLWLVFVASVIVLGVKVGTRQATEAELQVGQAARAATMTDQASLKDPALENLLITAADDGPLPTTATALANRAQQQLAALPQVASVSQPIPSADGKALLLQVRMNGDADTASERVDPLLKATAALQGSDPRLRVEESGTASVDKEFQEWLGKDVAKATKISVPVTLVILVIAFGSLVMAGIPVLLALSGVGAGIGLWGLASQVFPDPGMVPDVIILIGMAVGVDYSLFYLRRYREELHAGEPSPSAVEIAAATSGHAVIVSGTAVILSMAALYLSGSVVFSGMASGAIIIVAVAMLSSVTVLPALLVKIGPRAARKRSRFSLRRSAPGSSSRLWNSLLSPALRHPLLSLLISVTALVALAAPALHMSLKSTQLADFPRNLATMRVYDRILQHFPDSTTGHVVVARVDAGYEAELKSELDQLAHRAGEDPLFSSTLSTPPRFASDGRTGLLELTTAENLESPKARQALDLLRSSLVPDTVGTIPGARYAVGGAVAADVDYTDNLRSSLPPVVGAVLAITLVVMLFAFRSPVIAMTTVILNLLSSAAAFGFLTLVFQGTWAQSLLSFTSTKHVVSWVPLMLFVVLSGLSLDYHVFVVSRIREAKVSGMTTRNAIASGISRSAGVVTSAALVMVAVFAVFGTLTFIELKQMGVGLAAAIVLDATVIRVMVLPALMTLLGEANWWTLRRRRPGGPTPTALPVTELDQPTVPGRR